MFVFLRSESIFITFCLHKNIMWNLSLVVNSSTMFLDCSFLADSTRGKKTIIQKRKFKKNKISSLEIHSLSFWGVIVLPDHDLK